tara:strand:+ start:853 stop:1602 length:750 start_codon:yes stop_codon:yes gene_type:complete
MELNYLEENIQIDFNDKNLLRSALTHKSFLNDQNHDLSEFNQRLEFLGDSVLGLVISNHLFNENIMDAEGILTDKRSRLVNEISLALIAKSIDLPNYILMSEDEYQREGHLRNSTIADALEALIGAVFIDQGYKVANNFILKLMSNEIININSINIIKDPKSRLQELVQSKGYKPPKYLLVNKTGPAHLPLFEIQVQVNNVVIANGIGERKLNSQQDGAANAIKILETNGFECLEKRRSVFSRFFSNLK